jgi:LPS-assembly protein
MIGSGKLLTLLGLCLVATNVWPQERLFCEKPPLPETPLPEGLLPIGPEELQMFADHADVTRAGQIELRGGVAVRGQDKVVAAGRASYDPVAGRLVLEDDVRFQQPGVGITGEKAEFDYGAALIAFTESTFSLPDRPARGAAESLVVRGEGSIQMDGIEFTTCPVGNNDWKLKARDLDMDLAKGQATGRGVRLRFKGVPILYTPFISFPLSDARKSGFLLPDLNTSDRTGTDFRLPYYFNLRPNLDLTLTPRWMSRRGLMLGSEFRYLTQSTAGTFEFDYLPEDRSTKAERSFGRVRHQTIFASETRTRVLVDNASDSQYFEDFGGSIAETSITHLDRKIHTEHLGKHWAVFGLLQNYQTIDTTIPRDERPYERLPQVALQGLWPWKVLGLGLRSELANYHRDVGVTGVRFAADPSINIPWDKGSYYVVPEAKWHYLQYELSDVEPGDSTNPSVSVPEFSLDAGVRFERTAGKLGKLAQTLEPRVLYTYIPFRDQTNLPVFDTGLADFNTIQLFRKNRFVGGDRIGDSNTLSVGLTSRLLEGESGKQILTATIGQAYYIDDQRVGLPDEPSEVGRSSEILAELGLDVYKNWSVDLGYEYDTEIDNTSKAEVGFQFRPADDKILNMGYRFRRAQLEQYDVSFAWPLARSWDIVGRWLFAADEKTSLDRFLGLEYQSCCWGIRLVGRRHIIRRTGESDTTISLQLELKGFSNVGSGTDKFLEHGILGYSAD